MSGYLGLILEGSAGSVVGLFGTWLVKRRQDPRTRTGQKRVADALQTQLNRLQAANEQRVAEKDAAHAAEIGRLGEQYRKQIEQLGGQYRQQIAYLEARLDRRRGNDRD